MYQNINDLAPSKVKCIRSGDIVTLYFISTNYSCAQYLTCAPKVHTCHACVNAYHMCTHVLYVCALSFVYHTINYVKCYYPSEQHHVVLSFFLRMHYGDHFNFCTFTALCKNFHQNLIMVSPITIRCNRCCFLGCFILFLFLFHF